MKRVSLLIVTLGFVTLGVLVSGCGSSSPAAPTTPTNPTFTATLSPANENPAIVGPEASGSGTATVTMVTTKDGAGNITAATATFVVNLSGFPAGTPINIAHIHQAAAGVNGSVVVNSGLTAGQNVLTNGSGTFTASNLTVDAALANTILNNPAGFYFNVHSTLNPGGVARGQLVRVQ
jgi:hypothetical protein